MKYEVGDIVEIVDRQHGHKFNIGEHVTIIKVDEKDGDYKCRGDNMCLSPFVREDEIKLVKTKTK